MQRKILIVPDMMRKAMERDGFSLVGKGRKGYLFRHSTSRFIGLLTDAEEIAPSSASGRYGQPPN